MTTCVFITGTNCAGKTTLAKELIKRFGGYGSVSRELTICKDSRYVFVGPYADEKKYGGVDALNQTKIIEPILRKAFSEGAEYGFCEGQYMQTFGLNLTNAMFAAERHLVVCLVAPLEVIQRRLKERSGTDINKSIAAKQQTLLRSAKKWAQIGVPTIIINTAENSTEQIADKIIKMIE